jgi:serine/threonine protein kinase/tetratricopeptide (TPR) repeat protein
VIRSENTVEPISHKFSREDWHELMPYFDQWLDATDQGRADMLARLSSDQPELHLRLVALIKADQAANTLHFLDTDALEEADSKERTLTIRDLRGKRLGAWSLEHLLGVGGAGQVWFARRCDGLHSGCAAVKVLHAAELDGHAQRRFAREARVLAKLQHPHVARLLDVGEDERSQRFLVIEYVDGQRIDQWCDARNAPISTRLRLFLQVCEAVAYAHANLIVHRDLKPSNIFVQTDANVKLLDFGVAKLLADENADNGDDATELTRIAGAMFTPEYASPEQFEGGSIAVTSDVYSLGVVLYVLLSGGRPYAAEHSTPAQLARAVVFDEPRRLTATTTADSAAAVTIAAQRGTSREHLHRQLRGDLDTIVGKALKKTPAERYSSVEALADDVRRYLAFQPIIARTDSYFYRVRKFTRRNWVGLGFAALLLLAVFGGTLGIAWEAHKAEQEASRAQIEAAKAKDTAEFTTHILAGIDPDRAKTLDRTLLRILLDTAANDARDQLKGQPAVYASIENTIANSYNSIGEFDLASQHWQLALTAAEATGADAGTRAHLITMRSRALLNHAHYREAFDLAQQAVALTASLPEDNVERLIAQSQLASIDCGLARARECHDLSTHIYDIQRKALGDDDLETLSSYVRMAVADSQLGKSAEAKAIYEEAIRRYTAKHNQPDSHTLGWIVRMAALNDGMNQFSDNEALISANLPIAQQLLGEKHRITRSLMAWLGTTLSEEKRYAESKPYLERALDLFNDGDEAGSFDAMSTEINLTQTLLGLHEDKAAEVHARHLVAKVESVGHLGDGGTTLSLLVRVLIQQKRYADAERELNYGEAQAADPSEHAPTSPYAQSFVDLYTAWGKPGLADQWRAKLPADTGPAQQEK